MVLQIKDKKDVILILNEKSKYSGYTETQVAILTSKINSLQKHFKNNKHDYHSKLGLLKSVSKRRKLLKYLKRKDTSRYSNIIDILSIRR